MPSSRNLFRCFAWRLLVIMDRSWAAEVSNCCYNFGNKQFRLTVQSTQATLSGSLGGRGPPGQRSRLELQALSNSLQLTSW
jgi:hypothetical protein